MLEVFQEVSKGRNQSRGLSEELPPNHCLLGAVRLIGNETGAAGCDVMVLQSKVCCVVLLSCFSLAHLAEFPQPLVLLLLFFFFFFICIFTLHVKGQAI